MVDCRKTDLQKAHQALQQEIIACTRCARMVEYRCRVAREKRRAFRDWEYWGRPVPSLGRPGARLLILGLAPAAHGANRTGRMFTGDRSGDFLFATMHRFGFCNQTEGRRPDDGLQLIDAYITAAIHCAPPQNKPLPKELDNCRGYLARELSVLKRLKVVLALGNIAWRSYLRTRQETGGTVPRPRPRFSHGASLALEDGITLIASYHPSQQNTQTGRLTQDMFDRVFQQARETLDGERSQGRRG